MTGGGTKAEARAKAASRKEMLGAAKARAEKQRDALSRAMSRAIARLEFLNRQFEVLQQKLPETKKGAVGRPGTWKGDDGYALVLLVDHLRNEKGYSITQAVDALREAKSGPWSKYGSRALQSRYQEACKYWEPLFKRLDEIATETAKVEAAIGRLGKIMSDEEVRALVRKGTVTKRRR